MTFVFGDSEYRDAIDLNPRAIPDLAQVKMRFDRDAAQLISRVKRRNRREAREWAAIARRLVIVATLRRDSRSVEWTDHVTEAGFNDAEYQALIDNAEARAFIALLIGAILVWLVFERSLV